MPPSSLRTLLALSALTVAGCKQDYALKQYDGDDRFQQLEAGEVDVLLVVDSSCSMQPYQRKLSSNFDSFLTFFEEGNVDYHIGVVTTTVVDTEIAGEPSNGELVGRTYITPDTDDGDALFSDLVSVGTGGGGYEMGLEAAYLALSEPRVSGTNEGFLREDAYLTILIVSDEEDASPVGVNEYINAFYDIKGHRNRDIFNASGLVVTNLESCNATQQASGATEGQRYMDVIEQTNGVLGSICDDDFETIVTELSLASSRLTDTFYLSQMPDPSSLLVAVNDEEIDCDEGVWWYELEEGEDGEERPKIVFDRGSMPPPNADVDVSYDLGNGNPDNFCDGD